MVLWFAVLLPSSWLLTNISLKKRSSIMKREEFLEAVSGNSSSQVTRLLLFHKPLSRVRITHAALVLLISPFSIKDCLTWNFQYISWSRWRLYLLNRSFKYLSSQPGHCWSLFCSWILHKVGWTRKQHPGYCFPLNYHLEGFGHWF